MFQVFNLGLMEFFYALFTLAAALVMCFGRKGSKKKSYRKIDKMRIKGGNKW